MNKDVSQGKQRQAHGLARQLWGKLTQDKLVRLDGKFEKFVGTMQEEQGHADEAAQAANRPAAKPEAPPTGDTAPTK
jgi:uncharacterized protein YjbJ (UPF0337 family)